MSSLPRPLRRAAVLAGLLLALLLAPAGAQPAHPFGGEVLDLTAELETVRSAPTLEARRQASQRLLQTLYRDPFLAQLGPHLKLERTLLDLAEGRAFDAAAFRAAGQAALAAARIAPTADVGPAELNQKLEILEMALSTPRGTRPPATGPPLDAEAFRNHRLTELLGTSETRPLAMESVPGARVLNLSSSVALPAGDRAAVALDLYGRVLAPAEGARGPLRTGLAHREVGRAVLGPEVLHPAGARSEDVLKGVGPTPWANNKNRFNSKATGTFPLPEAVRDWTETERLRAAGVAVYEPVAIVALPYAEWSASEGWRPVAVYVRRARENLRVSDLDHLSAARKRALVASLQDKISAELRGVGRTEPVSQLDVIRNFVERAGRTAGLFQGGMGQGRYYFHGMLHDQNVSLLGEIVDVGNGDGVKRSRAELQEAWSKSAYAWWQTDLKEYRDLRGANSETALFYRMAQRFNARLVDVTGGGLTPEQVQEIFAQAYRDGRRGGSAADPRRALTIRAERAAPREPDLSRYRRADGTLDWKRLTQERALHEGAGLAHFALALFLKEVAAVAATGDRVRIEEFFDGLLSTDFYQHYGLFVAGARVGEVAYVRYLQRYVKPQFVNGVLKTNLVLAAGMALPLIVEGNFEGKAFAISLGSLGLSSAAVKAGVSSLRWVLSLEQARTQGILARVSAGRLAKLGGWFYTAAELAVVLYVADELEGIVTERLDRAAARDQLGAAGVGFLRALGQARTPAEVTQAAEVYHQAWNDYRNFLYQPLEQDEALLAARLEKIAREAKLREDERSAALEKLRAQPALLQNVVRRHGSLEAYADHLGREDEAELQGRVDQVLAAYERERALHLREVYQGPRRGAPLLDEADGLEWLVRGARPGGAGDPWGSRSDLWATRGRARVADRLGDALGAGSRNRLEAYDDEAEVLRAAAAALRADGRSAEASAVEARLAGLRELAAADRRLSEGPGLIETGAHRGIRDALEESTR